MALGSKVCPYCGRLNAEADVRCSRCERRLPAAWERSLAGLSARYFGGAAATALFALIAVGVYLALIAEAGGWRAPLSIRGTLAWGALRDNGLDQPWRYLSAIFVHFGLIHLAFNGLALASFGRALEQALGSARFSVLLLVSGALGFVASDVWYFAFPPAPITGGLSGGIFGLLGAEVGMRFAARDPAWRRAAVSAVGYALVMVLLGLNVNNAAHLGGLAAGAGLGWAFSRVGSSTRLDRPFGLLAGALTLATLGAIALCRLG